MATKRKAAKKSSKTSKKVTKVASRPAKKIVPTKIESFKRRQVPIGVKIIGVINYIVAVLLVIVGLVMIFMPASILESMNEPDLEGLSAGIVIAIGIIVIAFELLAFFIGRGLFRGEQWARIVMVVFTILSIISGISEIFQIGITLRGVISLIIWIIIGGYLTFSKEVSKSFA